MLREEIIKFYKNYKKGTYVTIEYQAPYEKKTKAAAKKEGHHIYKRTIKTVRLGCDYNNMTPVKEGKANGTIGERECYEMADPLYPNLFYYNKTNGRWYLRIGNVDNNNSKSRWFDNGNEITKDEAHSYLQPSAIKSNGNVPIVQNLCLENIITLG